MRAATYLRRSTDKQEASIVDQRNEVAELAKRRGHTIVAEFVDDGISGDATEKRLGFQQMIQAASRKEFDVVLCWDQDRFGRFDPLEAGYWIKPMRDAGVALETVAQGRIDWNDFAGRLIYTVTQEGKHAYLRDLARNINRSVRKVVESGVWCSAPPFGYDKDKDGKLILGHPDEVAAVRRIFELRLEGLGYRSIAKIMRQEARVTPKGNAWEQNGIKYILTREAYTGVLIYGRRNLARYERTFNDLVRVPNAHPAIITSEQFTAAKLDRGNGNKGGTRIRAISGALTGLLTCGRCGSPMYCWNHGGKLGYVCGVYHRGGGCGCCRVYELPIRDRVVDAIQSKLNRISPKIILEKIRRKTAQVSRVDYAKDIARLEKQIATATERLMIVPESALPIAQKKLNDLIEQRSLLTSSRPVPSIPRVSDRTILEHIENVSRDLRSLAPAEANAVFRDIIASVRCDFRQLPQGGKRRFFEWTGGAVILADGSPKEYSNHLR